MQLLPGAREDPKNLPVGLRKDLKAALIALGREGCVAASYALSGPEPLSNLCVRHLRNGWRTVVVFPSPNEVAIVMIDRHHSSNDPYVKMAKHLRIELYEGTKNKPPCCDAATLPPLDSDGVAALGEEQDRLIRSRRRAGSEERDSP